MNEPGSLPRHGPRALTAVAVAAVLGLGFPGGTLLRVPRPRYLESIDRLDRSLASLAKALPPGARVGVVLRQDPASSSDELAFWRLAQYALAPAVVRPIVGPRCSGADLEVCGVLAVGYLVVRTAAEEDTALASGAASAFAATASAPDLLLLERRKR